MLTSSRLIIGSCLSIATILTATAQMTHQGHAHHESHDHSSHLTAPIGVMRDHVHPKGSWMISYRYMHMFMNENYSGANTITDETVLNEFMVAPTDMTMTMHMLGGMYGVSDKVTIGLMTGFSESEMDHRRRNGTTFVREADGFSDTKMNVMWEVYNNGKHRLQINNGLSLPTGEIDERKPNGNRFGYSMQPGSGTWDLLPGISYSAQKQDWSWGGQLNAVFRLGENDNSYNKGDRLQVTAWGSRQITDNIRHSLRLDYQAWQEIEGQDPEISAPFMAPPMDPARFGGQRLNALVGVDYTFRQSLAQGTRIGLELGTPLWQNLNGPRLGTDYMLTLGVQKGF